MSKGLAPPNRILHAELQSQHECGDVTLIVEGAGALTNDATWNGVATNINGTGWNSASVTETGSPTPSVVRNSP